MPTVCISGYTKYKLLYRERVEEAISCIDRSELQEMIEESQDISVSCQFCDRRYAFTPVDLKALLERKTAGSEKE